MTCRHGTVYGVFINRSSTYIASAVCTEMTHRVRVVCGEASNACYLKVIYLLRTEENTQTEDNCPEPGGCAAIAAEHAADLRSSWMPVLRTDASRGRPQTSRRPW